MRELVEETGSLLLVRRAMLYTQLRTSEQVPAAALTALLPPQCGAGARRND